MANLALAQDNVRAKGTPWLRGALQSLLDPYKSADALPLSVENSLADRPDFGMPAAHLVVRAAAHLQPPSTPGWMRVLPKAVERVSAMPDWPSVTTGKAFAAAWMQKLPVRAAVMPDWKALQSLVGESASTEVLCAAALSPSDPPEAARARGMLLDRLDARSVDGADAVLILETALLSGLGPRDRFNRRAREAVASMQDPSTGLWPTRPEAAVEVTFFALLLLMRGG